MKDKIKIKSRKYTAKLRIRVSVGT